MEFSKLSIFALFAVALAVPTPPPEENFEVAAVQKRVVHCYQTYKKYNTC
jgi:hypothetical protein